MNNPLVQGLLEELEKEFLQVHGAVGAERLVALDEVLGFGETRETKIWNLISKIRFAEKHGQLHASGGAVAINPGWAHSD